MLSISQDHRLAGRPVGKVGFGPMGLTWGPNLPSEDESFAVMKAAVDAGATVFSTATFYGNSPDDLFANVKLIKRFFDKYPDYSDRVTLILKGGVRNLNPVPLAELDAVVKDDIYQSEDIVGVLQKYKHQGLIKAIGLCEARAAIVERASKLEASLFSYEDSIREAVEYCGTNQIPLIAYSPHGRGFLTRRYAKPEDIPEGSWLNYCPRLQGEAFHKNLELVDKLDEVAREKGISRGQLAMAWVTGLHDMVIPIPGTTKPERAKENAEAISIKLSEAERKRIDEILASVEIVGGRYPPQADSHLGGKRMNGVQADL